MRSWCIGLRSRIISFNWGTIFPSSNDLLLKQQDFVPKIGIYYQGNVGIPPARKPILALKIIQLQQVSFSASLLQMFQFFCVLLKVSKPYVPRGVRAAGTQNGLGRKNKPKIFNKKDWSKVYKRIFTFRNNYGILL